VVRELSAEAIASMQRNAAEYVEKGQSFKEKLIRIR
jgi:carbonic anhydrase/acetyltransferase-like protein (isoleucine patch superfamily)